MVSFNSPLELISFALVSHWEFEDFGEARLCMSIVFVCFSCFFLMFLCSMWSMCSKDLETTNATN